MKNCQFSLFSNFFLNLDIIYFYPIFTEIQNIIFIQGICGLLVYQSGQENFGVAVLGVLLEVNSIFLHLNKLLFFIGKQNTYSYHLSTILMYFTCFLFRLAPCMQALWYFWSHFPTITWPYLAIILPTNIFLFVHSCQLLLESVRRDVRSYKQVHDGKLND